MLERMLHSEAERIKHCSTFLRLSSRAKKTLESPKFKASNLEFVRDSSRVSRRASTIENCAADDKEITRLLLLLSDLWYLRAQRHVSKSPESSGGPRCSKSAIFENACKGRE